MVVMVVMMVVVMVVEKEEAAVVVVEEGDMLHKGCVMQVQDEVGPGRKHASKYLSVSSLA